MSAPRGASGRARRRTGRPPLGTPGGAGLSTARDSAPGTAPGIALGASGRAARVAVLFGGVCAALGAGCVSFNADCAPGSEGQVGELALGLDLAEVVLRAGEAPAGNLVADAFYEHFRQYPDAVAQDVDVALVPAGGIASGGACGGGERLGPGTVTAGDLADALPLNHKAVLMEMSGQALVELLAHGVSRLGDGGSAGLSPAFPQVSHLRFQIDCSEPPATEAAPTSRVDPAAVTVLLPGGGELPLDVDATYLVATSDAVLQGEYGYPQLGKEIPVGGRPRDRLVVQDYLLRQLDQSDGAPLDLPLEGRIQGLNCTP